MKSIIAFACIICIFAFVGQIAAVPIAEANVAEPSAVAIEDVADIGEHVVSRQKRATCDLLSFTGVNHAACAGHCVLKGFRGGYCNGQAVCVCRH